MKKLGIYATAVILCAGIALGCAGLRNADPVTRAEFYVGQAKSWLAMAETEIIAWSDDAEAPEWVSKVRDSIARWGTFAVEQIRLAQDVGIVDVPESEIEALEDRAATVAAAAQANTAQEAYEIYTGSEEFAQAFDVPAVILAKE